jgi:hypothetical protein
LINDPKWTVRINDGLRVARQIALRGLRPGSLAGAFHSSIRSSVLSLLVDCISWVRSERRTTESQLHRELASGVSFRWASRMGPMDMLISRLMLSRARVILPISLALPNPASNPKNGLAVGDDDERQRAATLCARVRGPNYHEKERG